MEGPIDIKKMPNGVNIQYAAVNFRDVMLATGRLSAEVIGSGRLDQECILGFEYSGVNKRGQRVMGTVISGAMVILLMIFFNKPYFHLLFSINF